MPHHEFSFGIDSFGQIWSKAILVCNRVYCISRSQQNTSIDIQRVKFQSQVPKRMRKKEENQVIVV
jgi:hypothetical protein